MSMHDFLKALQLKSVEKMLYMHAMHACFAALLEDSPTSRLSWTGECGPRGDQIRGAVRSSKWRTRVDLCCMLASLNLRDGMVVVNGNI